MASITMTTSFHGVSATTRATKQLPTTARRLVVIPKASSITETEKTGIVMAKASRGTEAEIFVTSYKSNEEKINGRRDLVFAAAAVAACSVAKIAMADEPKRGTSEALKKYGSVCVTMPTARICHK
ncbi:unnamed protein product [Ilex paraguariensis]|uniref:Photosystem II 5 kDa protein, chloroplastic n=1 Tax=Ilex paraguariensis TaxID=185542 RepID=A0ABC8T6C6_9AQUA